MTHRVGWLLALALLVPVPATRGEEVTVEAAERALRKAVGFFRESVSIQGGYLWRYSSDLATREGEGSASATTAWVQPPGTPTIGMAYLEVLELTGDAYYRDAAVETGHALAMGQLRSGGWDYRIEFGPDQRRLYAYRMAPPRENQRNTTTLDDNTTQSALRCLMLLDQELQFQDKTIHDAAQYALGSLLKAQFPNGAWAQRFSEFPDPAKHPILKASYPDSWPRNHPDIDYRSFYTFNDNAIADVVATLFLAAEIYDDEAYRESAEKAGGFILLAQMPEPQPAWAQQYNAEMQPAWARRFEPPAITGGESQGVMRTLMYLYRQTGDEKYLQPIPRAVAYLRKSALPNGGLARFYELKTNKPLYFTKDYQLTYSSDDMPTHYAFITGSSLDAIEAEYRKLKAASPADLDRSRSPGVPRLTPGLAARTREVIDAMDNRGAWLENGRLRNQTPEDPAQPIIDTRRFVSNIRTLAQFIAASRARP